MQSPFKSTKNKEKIMGTIRDAKTEILRQAFVKERIAFLNMPFHRKVQFVQSYVTFQNGDTTYVVPGYYAADGNAANTGAVTGSVWRVNFTPHTPGRWSYQASFRTGKNIAVEQSPDAGVPTAFDGAKGSVKVLPTDKTGRDFRGKGMLRYIGLAIIGPEDPLAAGAVDAFEAVGIKAFGPSAKAAQLEADKAFAKEIMRANSIPTGESRTFTTFEDAKAYIASRDEAVVIKAAGLAKGKGVFVCDEPSEGILAAEQIMVGRIFGDAGDRCQ